MSLATGTARQFAELIREVTGNIVPAERHDFLDELAERRRRALALRDVPAYLQALAAGDLEREWEPLVSFITIKESYFFRAPQQFDAIREHVLPRLLRARAATRRLRIWSAACARGEEPATLAMLLAAERDLAGWDWSIVATDLDAEAVGSARRGIYSERAVAQVPPELLGRWFLRRGKLFELAPALLARIDYRPLNLAQPPFALPADEYDLILLRNVLIYFRRPLQRWVATQVTKALARKGYLFLGASETLWQIHDELEAVDLKTCFCYRHRRTPRAKLETAPAVAGASAPAERRPAPKAKPPEPRPVADRPPPTPPLKAPTPVPPAPEPAPSVQERLMAAARQLADNRVAEAKEAIAGILAEDPAEPSGHALEGFLHDLNGRAEEASAAYRAALYLEPALFQARLLLADCLLRLGHKDKAAHQFREVLATLSGGRERALAALADLPLPDRERALRRCRQALQAR